MNTFTVSFFGHRRVENFSEVERRLDAIIGKLIREQDCVEFLVGRSGDFDQLVSSAVRRCKRTIRADNNYLVLVLPYTTGELRRNPSALENYYDEIEICAESTASHYKSAYQVRNRNMVDRSDLVVCYVDRETGGAYTAMRYAMEKKIPCLNCGFFDPICDEKT